MLIYDSVWIDNFFFVSSYLDGRVLRVDLSGKVISKYDGFKNPLALAKCDDKVYLLDVGTLRLYRYIKDEDRWVLEGFPYSVSHPSWIEFNGRNLVVVDKDKRALLNFGKEGDNPSLFLSSPLHLFDMPCSIKFSSKEAYLLANGERTLIEFSLNGEPLNLWELTSSPVCWTTFKDRPYLLCNGYFLTLKEGKLLKKVVNPKFKVILSSDSLFLWDGSFVEEINEDDLEEINVSIRPGRLVGVTADLKRAEGDFKALVNYMVERGKSLNLSLGEILREAGSNLSLDTLLRLHSKVLLIELDFKRIYPNIIKFLSSLSGDFIRGIFPQLKEILRLFTFTDRLWFMPWEIYWRIPYAERKEFKGDLYELLAGVSYKPQTSIEVLNFALYKIKDCLKDLLVQDSKQKALRDLDFLTWIIKVALRNLLVSGYKGEIKSFIELFLDWREGIDFVSLSGKLEARDVLGKIISSFWGFNNFYFALGEEIRGVGEKLLIQGGEVKKLTGIFLGSYALKNGRSIFVSDWGEGSLYKLSLDGHCLWRKDGLLGVNFLLLVDNRLYVSGNMGNLIWVINSVTGEMEEEIVLPNGSKIGKLFMGKSGDVLCSFYSMGRTILRNLVTGQDIFYSYSDFTYLTPDDTFILFFPDNVYSYVSDKLRFLFDPRLLTFRDWIYRDGIYIGNLLWLGKVISFKLSTDSIEDVKTIFDRQFSAGVPISIDTNEIILFYSLGYLRKISLY